MQISDTIKNRVDESGLITINLEDFFPKEPLMVFDLKDFLFQGLILREKDYRQALKEIDWKKYEKAHVTITCSADAVVPQWAYMLAAANLQAIATSVYFGTTEEQLNFLYHSALSQIKPEEYSNQRIVIKGCGQLPVPRGAFVQLTALLRPFVKSIMYGEPCSTVPVYKAQVV